MKALIISCSLNAGSKSAALATQAAVSMRALGAEVSELDLRQFPNTPFCDAGGAYGSDEAKRFQQEVTAADAILLAVPIYNFDVNAAAKNLIELTGKLWRGKIVGFLCAAGGQGSYMSVMALANSLMLDFRCLIVPRFVYTTGAGFNGDGTPDDEIVERIEELASETHRITTALLDAGVEARESKSL